MGSSVNYIKMLMRACSLSLTWRTSLGLQKSFEGLIKATTHSYMLETQYKIGHQSFDFQLAKTSL